MEQNKSIGLAVGYSLVTSAPRMLIENVVKMFENIVEADSQHECNDEIMVDGLVLIAQAG